jgi:hypothetical protein
MAVASFLPAQSWLLRGEPQRFALRMPSWSKAMIHLQMLADPSTIV